MASILEKATREFIERWTGRGDEKQETQRFWLDLMQNVLSVSDAIDSTLFEYRTVGNGFIDVLCPEARLLVEQKSAWIDLDKPEIRQGTPVTPVQQALRYADALPFSMKPAVLCTCNFKQFRIYDLEQDPRATNKPVDEFALSELENHIDTLRRVFSTEHSRVVVQQKLSEHAGMLVADLHNALAAQYANPDDLKSHHSLATLTVRIVFALYAEDAGLFPADSFSGYVKSYDAGHLRRAMLNLFDVLDTDEVDRDPYLEAELRRFPYVNGGLFHETIEIPHFTEEIRQAIIRAGELFSWKDISPVIFGSLMEETLSHDQRRKGGMHYTTVKNIHRLIDPLFLNDLKAELDSIENDSTIGEKARDNRLVKYQNKLANLRFLDPACGSGNFLTETFLQLRSLENRVIADRLHGQGYMDFGGDESLTKVRIDQFHGIEINDFAVSVAKTALWIAEQQALDDTEAIAEQALPHLPLHDSGNIIQANALRYDWNELLPGSQCSYVMGNPPFIGHVSRTDQTAEDMKLVWGKDYDGYLDYATGWHRKASQYLTQRNSAFAFVSTNSVVQGQPVAALFKPLFADGWRIRFAHRTFAWDAQSTDVAHVHVVIIGMDKPVEKLTPPPMLFEYPNINEEPISVKAAHINPYLIDGPNVFVGKRSQKNGPLSPMLNIVESGSMPLDGGNLIINSHEEYDRAMSDSIAARFVRPFRMGKELINGIDRWCLWLLDAEPIELKNSNYLHERVTACRKYRETAPIKGDAYKHRTTSWLFRDNHQPNTRYLAIPKVFSEDREYMTCDWYSPDIIAGDMVYTCLDPEGLAFSIIESKMFMVWQQVIGGRLESRCRFSNTVVWNNLPLPQLDDGTRGKVIDAGQRVLDARANHLGQSLAALYNPNFMPVDLRKAHEELDRVVDIAFGSLKPCRSDDERLQTLFDRYDEMTE